MPKSANAQSLPAWNAQSMIVTDTRDAHVVLIVVMKETSDKKNKKNKNV